MAWLGFITCCLLGEARVPVLCFGGGGTFSSKGELSVLSQEEEVNADRLKKKNITVSWLVWFGLVAKLCPTLATPWTIACQAPLSVGFSREEYWSGLPFPLPGYLPNPGVEPGYPALQAGSLPTEPPGKPLV